MNKIINIAIFASGSGTNAENIINYFRCNNNNIRTKLIISSSPDAYVLERAKKLHVPAITLNKEELGHISAEKDNSTPIITKVLEENKIDYIILAGYLYKIPQSVLLKYTDKIINIHPALLPKYGGKGMYGHHVHEAVIANKEKESGITIHLVNDKYDSGKILFQAKCTISPDDTPEDLFAKIHLLEQEFFPKIIEKYIINR